MSEPTTAAMPADFELAKAALLDMTPESTIGAPAGSLDEGEGTVTVYFESKKAGYPGWRWTVSIAHVEGAEPTVLETELTPGDGALLSPDWVPWADRLADYQAAQAAERAAAEADADDSEDSDDDDDSDDYYDDDPDDDDAALLHGGDLDGVDIDEIADVVDDSDDESDDDDEDSDDDDSDDEDDDDSDDEDDDDSDDDDSDDEDDDDE